MATPEQQLLSLAEEATCPICLGYFTDPGSLQCGHTFCTPCITRYWEGEGLKGGPYPCPQCRETAPTSTLRPNRHLASIVQILAQGVPPVAPPREGPRREGHLMCPEHDEKLKLFCEEDQTPICVVCDRSREHRGHTVTPIREAAQEYKDKFQSYLDDVKRELENILGLRHKEDEKLTELEANFQIQRERIISVFNKVQKFLEKEKCRHLSIVEEKEKKIQQRIGEKVTKLDIQQAMVRSQITEIESKCQQPDVELLKDVKSILSRFEKMKCQHLGAGHFKENEKETEKNENGVEEEKEVVDEEKDVEDEEEDQEIDEEDEEEDEQEDNEEQLDVEKEEDLQLKIIESLEWRWARSYSSEVTLDADTANPWLVLSKDGRSVRDGDIEQDLPDTPERFNPVVIVLGRERLSSGRHYWEVEVGDKTRWTLGMCDESVSRKGAIKPSPEKGFWTVWLRDGDYIACTTPNTHLTPRVPPRVVGLFLDFAAGRLAVYNVTDRSLLFTFSEDSFPSTLRPFFSPGTNNIRKNEGALRLLSVTGQEGEPQIISPGPLEGTMTM